MNGVFPGGSVMKNLPANAGDVGLIPGSGRSPERGNGNPLQYSWSPMNRGAAGPQSMGLQRVGHDQAHTSAKDLQKC